MGLSIRSRLAGTNPYLAWALEYILTYARQAGGEFTITSVNRTIEQQWDLWKGRNPSAVRPGCSQHQYGLAVDVFFENADWREWYLASVRNFGLTTVSGNSVHVQLVPGARFREWSESQGLCPAPYYRNLILQDPLPVDSQTFRECGPLATRSSCRPLRGCTCYYP